MPGEFFNGTSGLAPGIFFFQESLENISKESVGGNFTLISEEISGILYESLSVGISDEIHGKHSKGVFQKTSEGISGGVFKQSVQYFLQTNKKRNISEESQK